MVICWDKDDIESFGIFKVDVFSFGMLICICKVFDLMMCYYGVSYMFFSLLQEDFKVYDMFCVVDLIGVFQVESCVQMNFLLCMWLCYFYDLVIEVVII